jgi:hypothetical protein
VRKTSERRLVALLLPLPLLAAGGLYVKLGHPTRTVEVALTFPEFCLWYLGTRSVGVAGAIAVGFWYLLGAMLSHALLCGRERLGRAAFTCVLATGVVMAATMLLLRD